MSLTPGLDRGPETSRLVYNLSPHSDLYLGLQI